MFARMAAANASARGQRVAILASPLGELTGFSLVVDCGMAVCGGERTYTLAALAACYSAGMTVGEALRRMRCGRGCGHRAGPEPAGPTAPGGAAWAGGAGVSHLV